MLVCSIYFLSVSATDRHGSGKRSVVNLRISLLDANDNPPVFKAGGYNLPKQPCNGGIFSRKEPFMNGKKIRQKE